VVKYEIDLIFCMLSQGDIILDLKRVVLIHPGREGRILGKAPSPSYTLMRLASLVPDDIDVEIWEENLGSLDARIRNELGPTDLVGITS